MKALPLTGINPRFHGQIIAALAPRLPNPQPKQDAQLLPLGADQDEGGGAGRITVRITRVGTKLLDLDNLYGSVKFLCDALRYAQLIPEDHPDAITLEVRQRKAPKGETGTLVEIISRTPQPKSATNGPRLGEP